MISINWSIETYSGALLSPTAVTVKTAESSANDSPT